MGAIDLVRGLTASGVSLETDGCKIKWRDPTGGKVMTPDALGELAAHKAEVIDFLTGGKVAPLPPRPSHCDNPHGYSVGGSPKTWTGKIVSMADWRNLSAWERHGPDGRMWNGLTRQWADGGAT